MNRNEQERVQSWVRDLRPRNTVQACLAVYAAALSIRLEEYQRVEAAKTARFRRTAPEAERRKRLVEAAKLGQELVDPATNEWVRRDEAWRLRNGPAPKFTPRAPEIVVLLLEGTAEGCRWMAKTWSDLASILEDGQFWDPADQRKSVRLLGKEPGIEDNADIRRMELAFVASGSKSLPPHLGDTLTEEMLGRPVPTREESAEILLKICEREIRRLLELAANHEKADSDTLHLHFDGTPEGKELRRRQTSAHRELMRTLDALGKMQKSADAEGSASMPDIGIVFDGNRMMNLGFEIDLDPIFKHGLQSESEPELTPEPTLQLEPEPSVEPGRAEPSHPHSRPDSRSAASRGRKRSRKASKRAAQKERVEAKRRRSGENKPVPDGVGFIDPRHAAEPEPPRSPRIQGEGRPAQACRVGEGGSEPGA